MNKYNIDPIYILIALIIFYYLFIRKKELYKNYRVGANEYSVIDNLSNPQQAAENLDQLNKISKK
jgi:hypothetical protein